MCLLCWISQCPTLCWFADSPSSYHNRRQLMYGELNETPSVEYTQLPFQRQKLWWVCFLCAELNISNLSNWMFNICYFFLFCISPMKNQITQYKNLTFILILMRLSTHHSFIIHSNESNETIACVTWKTCRIHRYLWKWHPHTDIIFEANIEKPKMIE